MHDQARVDPAGEKRAERHVGDELLLDRLRQKRVEPCKRIRGRCAGGRWDLPELLEAKLAVLPFQPVRRRKLAHCFEEAVRRERRLEGQIVAQRFVVELAREAFEREEGRQRRGERESLVRRVEERLDTEAIARGEELAFARIPDREREDAVEPRE